MVIVCGIPAQNVWTKEGVCDPFLKRMKYFKGIIDAAIGNTKSNTI